MAWLLCALAGRKPYPILLFYGESGAAKSSSARIGRELVDPAGKTDVFAEPKNIVDVVVAARVSHVLAYDNLSHLQRWLSDMFCRLSTGQTVIVRRYFTNFDAATFTGARPTIITSITELGTEGDFFGRTLLVELAEIGDDIRKTEAELAALYQETAPQILGVLLDVLAAALKRRPRIRPKRLPRLADFAHTIIAAEPALGWKPGTFLEDYRTNQQIASALVLEPQLVADALPAVMRKHLAWVKPRRTPWSGTFKQLLEELEVEVDDHERRARAWPRTSRGLSSVMRRIAPSLKLNGWTIDFLGHGKQGSEIEITAPKTLGPEPTQLEAFSDHLWDASIARVGNAIAEAAAAKLAIDEAVRAKMRRRGDGSDGSPGSGRKRRGRPKTKCANRWGARVSRVSSSQTSTRRRFAKPNDTGRGR